MAISSSTFWGMKRVDFFTEVNSKKLFKLRKFWSMFVYFCRYFSKRYKKVGIFYCMHGIYVIWPEMRGFSNTPGIF
jgi:hypothetical protein